MTIETATSPVLPVHKHALANNAQWADCTHLMLEAARDEAVGCAVEGEVGAAGSARVAGSGLCGGDGNVKQDWTS